MWPFTSKKKQLTELERITQEKERRMLDSQAAANAALDLLNAELARMRSAMKKKQGADDASN